MADSGWRAAAGVLLVEDDLLRQRRTAATVLSRPADACPACRGQMAVPGQPLLELLVLPAGTAEAAQAGELSRQIGLEPVADATAELLILGRQLHWISRAGLGARQVRVLAGGAWPASHATSRLTLPSTCLLEESRGADHSGRAGERREPVR